MHGMYFYVMKIIKDKFNEQVSESGNRMEFDYRQEAWKQYFLFRWTGNEFTGVEHHIIHGDLPCTISNASEMTSHVNIHANYILRNLFEFAIDILHGSPWLSTDSPQVPGRD
jgi:hypothetical protein